MTPLLVVVTGSLVALLGGLWARATHDRGAWRAGAALAVCLTAVGAWWQQPGGQIGAPVQAVAMDGQVPVTTTVVLAGANGRRRVRELALSRPVDGAQAALWAMLVLGLAGVVGQLNRPSAGRRAQLAAFLPAGAALAGLGLWLGAGGSASGEAPVRAFLTGLEGIDGFTVPPGEWTYRLAGQGALGAAAFAGALGALSTLGAPQQVGRLVPLGAALAVAGVLWQLFLVGGLVWRPAEACAWAAATALVAATAVEEQHAGLLVGAAVACAGLGLG